MSSDRLPAFRLSQEPLAVVLLRGRLRAFIVFGAAAFGCCIASLDAVASTRNAASASYSDVVAAVASAVDGDTVQIPAGTATWSSTLNVGSKGISIIGAGTGSTIINNAAGKMIQWSNTGSKLIRLSGIRFNNSDNQSPIVGIAGPATKIRVDHCYFNKGDCAVGTNYWPGSIGSGPVYGVVDHCTFINMKRAYFAMDCRTTDSAIGPPGNYDGATAWTEPILPGSDKMMYFEDNVFTWNTSLTDPGGQSAVYGQYGGKCCFRHNVTNGMDYVADAHGDSPSTSTMYYEIYNNTFNFGSILSQGEAMWQRGGQWIVHDNTFNYPYTSVIHMSVYWTSDTAAHRVKNSYFWGNTANGNSNQSALVGVKDSGQTPPGYSAANIRVNEQYFLHAPQSGQTYYPYTPLVYPHPLVSGSGGDPTPTPTPGGTPTPTPTPTPIPTPTPTPLGTSFDSIQGEVSSPFVVNSDNSISQSVETDDPAEGGRASYFFSIAESGDYTILSTVNCPDSGSNSLFVDIDSDPNETMIWHAPLTTGFELRTVTWAGSTTPRFWTLSPGIHRLVLRGREANARVKSLSLVARPAPPQPPQVVFGAGD